MAELTFAVRLLIAGTLIASAIPKLLAPPLVEVALAALLLTGVTVRPAAAISAGMFGLFAGVLLIAPNSAGRGDCGCLGQLHRQAMHWVAAEDAGLAVAAAFVAHDAGWAFRLYQLAGHAIPTA